LIFLYKGEKYIRWFNKAACTQGQTPLLQALLSVENLFVAFVICEKEKIVN